MTPFFRSLAAAVLLAAASSTLASPPDGTETFGEYVVHYNALPTAALGKAMASQYAIERSAKHGMLNISVQKEAADGTDAAVSARITGEASNLSGHKSPIEIREIPGQYVSYIGLFDVAPPDTYTFALSIQPTGSERTFELRFSHGFD